MDQFFSSILEINQPSRNSTEDAWNSIDGKTVELHKLENRLRYGLKKYKIKDVTQLTERIKRSEKRVEQYEDEERTDIVEQERKYLNELKQLQTLREELSLEWAVFLLGNIDKLELSELENRLRYGLAKCKIKDVTQLTERIKRSEKRIEQYEDEERTDIAEQETRYLRYLELLRKIVEKILFRKSNLLQEKMCTENTVGNLGYCRILNEEEHKRANLKNLFDDLAQMPCCAEKTIIELLTHFQQKLLKDCIVEELAHLKLEILHDQIKKEELFSEQIRIYLPDLTRAIYNEDCSSTIYILNKLLKKIRPLNLQEIQRLRRKTKQAAELIKDKDIILLVGITGSGKSTTIQFLTGYKMKDILVEIAPGKFLEHITIDGPIRNVTLKSVTSSPLSKSETRYIVPVIVQLKDIFGDHATGEIILCDAPGFDDTEGPEIDIVNNIEVIEAIKNCKSVKILALSSYRSLGDRGEGIQKLIRLLTNMISGIENRLYGIFYAFTKYPQSTDIHALLTDIKTSKVDRDPILRSDNTFMSVLTDIINKTRYSTEKIDPIHDDPKNLIEKLNKLKGICYPGEVFRFSISEESQNVILNQIQKYKLNIMCSIKHKNIDLVMYYLNNFKILNGFIKENSVREEYENSIQYLNENIRQFCRNVIEKFNRSLISQDGLKDEDIQEYTIAHDYIQQIQNLREHLGADLASAEILIENFLSELKRKHFMLKQLDLYNPLIRMYLDNFYLLQNSFTQLELDYTETCKEFAEHFDCILIQTMPELIASNEFKQIAEQICIISKCLPVLNHHLNGKVEENYYNIVQSILQHLNCCSEKASYLLSKVMLTDTDIESLKNCIILLRSAKETSTLQDQITKYVKTHYQTSIEIITTIYDEFIMKIIKYFDEINLRIKELFKKNKQNALEYVEPFVRQMEMIRTLPEIESKTAQTFYHTIQDIYGYMEQLPKDAEQLLNSLDHQSGMINYRPLARVLVRLKNIEWINRIFPGTYDSMMRHIEEELEEHASYLEHRLTKLDFSLKCPENVRLAQEIFEKIESISVLEHIVPNLKIYRDRINQYLLKITKDASDYIRKTFNLADRTIDHLKQELIELEQIKNEYDQLCLSRSYVRILEYLDINILNHEIENPKVRQDEELKKVETEKYQLESQLFTSDPNEYFKRNGYLNIATLNNVMTSAQGDYDELLGLIEEKRTNFDTTLTHLESIKRRYDPLLGLSKSNSTKENDFLEEERRIIYELLEKTIEKKKKILSEYEKDKQMYYFNHKLDVCLANNALIYITNCEKIGHRNVKEIASNTHEYFTIYIEEYGYFLDKEIERNFKCIITNKNDNFKQCSEDLEMRFQELSSLDKYGPVFDCLRGRKKLELWHQQFSRCYRTLDTKMKVYKISGRNQELMNLLSIAQALSCLDSFSTSLSANNEFRVLYEQYQNYIAELSQEAYKRVIDYITEGNYANIEQALSDLIGNSKFLILIKNKLENSLNKIIKNTKLSANHLHGKIEREENNQDRIREINENIEKVHTVLNQHHIMKLIDEKVKNVLQNFENEINEILSTVILNGVKNIEIFINANCFLEAERCVENLIRARHELIDHYILKSIDNKIDEIKTRLNNLIDDILHRYDFTDINNYPINPPKDIFIELRKATSGGYARYTQFYKSLSETIQEIFCLSIERARGSSMNDRSIKIRSIKHAVLFLPDELKMIFQLEIDELNVD